MHDKLDLTLLTINGVETGSDAPLHPIRGVEVSRDGQQLSSVFVTLAQFTGQLTKSGVSLATDDIATPDDVLRQFGEPYWRDDDEGEVIMFYEQDGGAVELQFEFPAEAILGYITIARPGVLADPEQRISYGVTKSWPPGN